MFVELHMIQNFAPSCLNRDDTNSPKDCHFGGARRARISSQCMKRAIRMHAAEVLPREDTSVRTRRLAGAVIDDLKERGMDPEVAGNVARSVVDVIGIDKKDEEMTGYLLFLGRREISAVSEMAFEKKDIFLKMADVAAKTTDSAAADKREGRAAKKPALSAEAKALKEEREALQKELRKLLDGGKSADVALYGRMLADIPKGNREAACQVAHALSTHKVDMEVDYFTAVDDLNPKEDTGAGMIENTLFNSACFYRYAVIHRDKLVANLGGDEDLADRALKAFLRASLEAIPTGKQNTFAAHNPPSFLLSVVREKGTPWSLANAFERPVPAFSDADGASRGYVLPSIERLDRYWGAVSGACASPDASASEPAHAPAVTWATLEEVGTGRDSLRLEHLTKKGPTQTASYGEFISETMKRVEEAMKRIREKAGAA